MNKPESMSAQRFFTDSTPASAARPAKSPAKSGTSWKRTATTGAATPTTTPEPWAIRHGATSNFSEGATAPGLGGFAPNEAADFTFSSDVCKHCENAGCLEACPTGALVRTQYGGVYLQPDICNGCAYCVVSCPFGVVQKNADDGRAFKCTFCTDRQKAGLRPACATACPTESILFGEIGALREQAKTRLDDLHALGIDDAVVYDPVDSSVGGIHAFFLLRGDPRQYNLPPNPEVPTVYAPTGWKSAVLAAGLLAAGTLFAFLGDD